MTWGYSVMSVKQKLGARKRSFVVFIFALEMNYLPLTKLPVEYHSKGQKHLHLFSRHYQSQDCNELAERFRAQSKTFQDVDPFFQQMVQDETVSPE
jgi:hypothetical protein